MKQMMTAALLAAVMLLSAPAALGAELTIPGEDELWEQAGEYGVTQGTQLDQGLSNLLTDALSQITGLFQASLATGAKLMAVVLLCALAQGAQGGDKGDGLRAVEIAGALSITALTMTDMAAMIGMGRDAIGTAPGRADCTLSSAKAAARRSDMGTSDLVTAASRALETAMSTSRASAAVRGLAMRTMPPRASARAASSASRDSTSSGACPLESVPAA